MRKKSDEAIAPAFVKVVQWIIINAIFLWIPIFSYFTTKDKKSFQQLTLITQINFVIYRMQVIQLY